MTAPTLSSACFTLHLFGPLQAWVRGEPLPHLRSRKGYWLLALLALRGNREVERQWLTGLLWPDSIPELAARSLRTSLNDLRRALGPEAARLRSPTPRTLSLDLTGAAVDVRAFDAAIRNGTPQALAEAVAVYQGPLLEGCGETWALEERQPRELAFLGALERLADQALQASDPATAERHLRRVAATDPFRESAQRALMRVLAAGGNYGAALQVYRDLRHELYRELNTHPGPETQQLFAALQAEVGQKAEKSVRSTGLVTQSTREEVRDNLPHALTHFIGREREIGALAELLAGSAVRLVTLIGVGGAGKSRLAVEVGRQLVAAMPDGAWLVELAPLSDPALVPQAVAAVLNVREETTQPLLPTLIGTLRPRQSFLILDNCEHLVEACAHLVEALLHACPGLRILATSREALGIAGERVYPVPPLSLPGFPRPDTEPSPLLASEAVRLFLDRATQLLPGYALSRGNSAAVAAICRRLDGLPLAIELAAGRLQLLSVEEIEARLDDRFRLLTNGRRTAQPRHQTLRAALDWSYDLLSPQEQILLRRLSVFAGGFTVAAVEAISTDSQQAEAQSTIRSEEVLDLLTALVDKSLVAVEVHGGVIRYRVLETVRAYGQEQLRGKERSNLEARHGWYFLELAERAEPELRGQDQLQWLERLKAEQGNLQTALEMFARKGDLEAGLRLGSVLGRYWYHRGQLAERWPRLVELLSALRSSSTVYAPTRAKALIVGAGLAGNIGDQATGVTLAQRSLDLWRELGDRQEMAASLSVLGGLALARGDLEQAHAFYEESLSIRRECGSVNETASSLLNLGNVARLQGDYQAAWSLYEQAFALGRQVQNQMMLGWTSLGMGQVALRQGDLERAEAHARESLTIWREQDNRVVMTRCLELLAQLAHEQGKLERMAQLFGAAEALREAVHYPLPAIDRVDYEAVPTARATLGEAAFTAAWEVGRATPLELIVAAALA